MYVILNRMTKDHFGYLGEYDADPRKAILFASYHYAVMFATLHAPKGSFIVRYARLMPCVDTKSVNTEVYPEDKEKTPG